VLAGDLVADRETAERLVRAPLVADPFNRRSAGAIFLDLEPAAAAKLLAEHIDDGRGYCRVCILGAQHGNHHWPCDIYNAVTMAMATRI
jgi:hypothetical protein